MALPVIPNVTRVVLEYTEATTQQYAANVLHFRTELFPDSLVFTLYSSLVDIQVHPFQPMSQTAAVRNFVVTPLDGVSASQTFVAPATEWLTGQSGGDFIPQGAALIKLQSGVRGGSNRGRIFLPFLAEGAQTAGFINPATLQITTDAWTDWTDDLASNGVEIGIVSIKNGNFTKAIHLTCERAIATQRRRQGRNRRT